MSIPLIDKIKPKNSGTFPMVDDIDVTGGFRAVPDSATRDAIPDSHRKTGMLVWTDDTSELWQLLGGIDNGSWALKTFGGGTVPDASEFVKGITTLSNDFYGSASSPKIKQITGNSYGRLDMLTSKVANPSFLGRVAESVTSDGTASDMGTIAYLQGIDPGFGGLFAGTVTVNNGTVCDFFLFTRFVLNVGGTVTCTAVAEIPDVTKNLNGSTVVVSVVSDVIRVTVSGPAPTGYKYTCIVQLVGHT